MTRAEQALARRWRSALLVCTLAALAGAVLIIWARIDTEATRADSLAVEADRRGDAVTTLAGDVRRLRTQVKDAGEKPVAPDPSQAIDDLRGRAKVPVPLPGPQGSAGTPGKSGQDGADGASGRDGVGAPGQDGKDGEAGSQGPPGPTVTGPPGPDGEDGADGQPGIDGKDGRDGVDGQDGEDGRDGQSCPSGYSLQPSSVEPGALVCKSSGGSSPSDPQSPSSGTVAYLPRRRG